jgi:hypothetical protein
VISEVHLGGESMNSAVLLVEIHRLREPARAAPRQRRLMPTSAAHAVDSCRRQIRQLDLVISGNHAGTGGWVTLAVRSPFAPILNELRSGHVEDGELCVAHSPSDVGQEKEHRQDEHERVARCPQRTADRQHIEVRMRRPGRNDRAGMSRGCHAQYSTLVRSARNWNHIRITTTASSRNDMAAAYPSS